MLQGGRQQLRYNGWRGGGTEEIETVATTCTIQITITTRGLDIISRISFPEGHEKEIVTIELSSASDQPDKPQTPKQSSGKCDKD